MHAPAAVPASPSVGSDRNAAVGAALAAPQSMRRGSLAESSAAPVGGKVAVWRAEACSSPAPAEPGLREDGAARQADAAGIRVHVPRPSSAASSAEAEMRTSGLAHPEACLSPSVDP
eukprot:97302-Chlamydomonas_euryale.AAC.1